MDDFSENQDIKNNADEEFSTVFSAPTEHNDRVKSPKKRKILAVVSSFLAVLILVAGTLAVIKLIPKKDDDGTSSQSNSISVIDFDKSKFNTVTVKNKNGEFVFSPEGDTDISWYPSGIDKDKISTSKTGEIVSAAANISAIMEITKKTYSECGFDNPICTVSVVSKELGDYYILLGGTSPDNTGVYLYSSLDEKIYLVEHSAAESFNFNTLDLANTDSVPAASIDTKDEKYVDDNGSLISFDKLTISGSKYQKPVVVTPVSSEESTVGFDYKVISPLSRYAESTKVSLFFAPFSSGISVSGVYSFETDVSAQNEFGLNNPTVVLKLEVCGKSITYKFALQSDGYYAMSGDGVNTIKKVSAAALEFLGAKENDIYNKTVYLRNLSELKNMTFSIENASYSFDISENSEDSDEKFTVYYGDKRIKSENFQNFYMHFVSMSLVDFSYEKVGSAAMTVKITDNNGSQQTLSFYNASPTEYYCSIDNIGIGKITSSTYNKLLSDIQTVSKDKDVEN